MHMVSRKDLHSAELETVRISKNPTTVMTANGEVQTREEATVYVKELDLFVTVMLLEEPLAVLPHGNSVRIMGVFTTGPAVKNHIPSKMAGKIDCNISNYVLFVVPGLSTSSSTSSTPTSSTSSSQGSVFDVRKEVEV